MVEIPQLKRVGKKFKHSKLIEVKILGDKMSEISSNIRKIRQQRGFSQAKAAKNVGISASAWSKIETGETDVNVSRLFQIAKALRVSIQEIVYGALDRQEEFKYLEKIKCLKLKVHENKNKIEMMQRRAIILYEKVIANSRGI